MAFFLQYKIWRDIFRVYFFHWSQLQYFALVFLGKFQNVIPCLDVEQFVSIGASSAEETLLFFDAIIWRRGTQRQHQLKSAVRHPHTMRPDCVSTRDPPSPVAGCRPLPAADKTFYSCSAPAEICALKADRGYAYANTWRRSYINIRPNGSQSVTGCSSILCCPSKNTRVDVMSPSHGQISVYTSHAGYVGGEKQASPEVDSSQGTGLGLPLEGLFLSIN